MAHIVHRWYLGLGILALHVVEHFMQDAPLASALAVFRAALAQTHVRLVAGEHACRVSVALIGDSGQGHV